MPEEIENLKKKYPEFFKEFPAKLMELISSDEISSKISDICVKNGVKNEGGIELTAYLIIFVLLGELPQEILSKALVTNLKIDGLVAKKISEEANSLIFSQVSAPPSQEKPIEMKEEPVKEEPPKPRGKDIYHEPIA